MLLLKHSNESGSGVVVACKLCCVGGEGQAGGVGGHWKYVSFRFIGEVEEPSQRSGSADERTRSQVVADVNIKVYLIRR